MGTVYTLPVVTFYTVTPSGTVIDTTNDYNDCVHGLQNSLLIAGNGISNGVGRCANVAGTELAYYNNPQGDPDRAYYVAINRQSDWINCTVTVSNIDLEGYRSVTWGYLRSRGEVLISSQGLLGLTFDLSEYNSLEEAERALGIPQTYPITYHPTNCTFPNAPTEATVGDIVSVSVAFSEGYGVVNPSTDAYVTCNGVIVPSTYSNGILTFNMPDPGA